MFTAIVVLLLMPLSDVGKTRGIQFRPISKLGYYYFLINFLVLMQLGAKHVETPFIEFGQMTTMLYFIHFLTIIPLLSFLENTFVEAKLAFKALLNPILDPSRISHVRTLLNR